MCVPSKIEDRQRIDKRIISEGSTVLSSAQSRYLPVETEIVAVVWSLMKFDCYAREAGIH